MDIHHTQLGQPSSLGSKLGLVLSSGLVSGFVVHRVARKYLSPWLPIPVIVGISIALLFSGLLVLLIDRRQDRTGKHDKGRLMSLLPYSIVYWLALDLSLFGFQKILHLQMIVPLGLLDTPFSSLSGENLVWAFYRWSYPFTLFIAGLQLISAYLLLFARTRLLALLIALPMLVHIIAMDYFYAMPTWVMLHALVLLTGVLSLLSLDYDRIKAFLLSAVQGLEPLPVSSATQLAIKLSVLLLPVLFLSVYAFPDKHPQFTGSYRVSDLRIDGQPRAARTPKDSVLTGVYLDLEDEFAFDFNDYRYRYIGTYHYQPKTDSIVVKWRYPARTLSPFTGRLTREGTGLRLDGRLANQHLQLHLAKRP